jgi:hypothetical protein
MEELILSSPSLANRFIDDFAAGPPKVEIARFEQLLSSSDEDDDTDLTLVNPRNATTSGIGGAMQTAVSQVSLLSDEHKTAVEASVKTLASIDPSDPRASITALEAMMAFSMSQSKMNFAASIAKASKQSLDTLLRSQG